MDLELGRWTPLLLQAEWSEEAAKSAQFREEESQPQPTPLVGLHQARLRQLPDGLLSLDLVGLTTTYFKEFRTEWTAAILDENNKKSAMGELSVVHRCLQAPGAFTNTIAFATEANVPPGQSQKVRVQGKVQNMTGAYHGHGMWMRFSQVQRPE